MAYIMYLLGVISLVIVALDAVAMVPPPFHEVDMITAAAFFIIGYITDR